MLAWLCFHSPDVLREELDMHFEKLAQRLESSIKTATDVGPHL